MQKHPTRLVRATITKAEHDRIRVAAIRADANVADFAADLLRAGLAALKDGKGRA